MAKRIIAFRTWLLLPDFCSGAAGLSGRFTEGFSLRRSHDPPNVARLNVSLAGEYLNKVFLIGLSERQTVEIGTVRREYLDRALFWNRGYLERKLNNYKAYYNKHRCHTGLAGAAPAERSGVPAQPIAKLQSYTWRQRCNGLFQPPTGA